MSAESYQQQLEQVNSKLDKILNLLQNGILVDADTPTYTGSRTADYILEESYTNNEPIESVIKRHAKAKKSKVGKDLDILDNIVDRTSEVGVTRGESENFLDSLSEGRDHEAGDGYNEWMESRAGDRDGI
jgi:hypothetical protein|tara:strand:+ start:666 stop:1055 length:390 start_codon:yes stop_codon:yes gene_type:complete